MAKRTGSGKVAVRLLPFRPRLTRSILFVTFGLLILVGALGCNPDPTDNSMPVQFENDLGQTITLSLCSNYSCTGFYYHEKLKAGTAHGENIAADGLITRWMIADTAGTRLGCIPLSFPLSAQRTHHKAYVRLSQKVPCPGSSALRARLE